MTGVAGPAVPAPTDKAVMQKDNVNALRAATISSAVMTDVAGPAVPALTVKAVMQSVRASVHAHPTAKTKCVALTVVAVPAASALLGKPVTQQANATHQMVAAMSPSKGSAPVLFLPGVTSLTTS